MRSKRIMAGLCALLFLAAAFSVSAFAQSSHLITGIIAPIDQNTQYDVSSVRPDSTIEYPLTADMFAWSGSPGNAGEPITRSQLRNSNITIKYTCNQTKVVKNLSLSTTAFNGSETACVKLETSEEFVSVKPLDFKLTMCLTLDGKRSEASEVTLFGTFENEEIEINDSYDFISISKGQVLSSSDSITNLEINLGADVQLFTRIQQGTKYYATAKNAFTDADNSMITKYPDIEAAVRIKSVNLRPVGNYVSMKDVGTFYVYTETGKYLGTTLELLPFHSLYYLTSKKITMNEGTGERSSAKSPGNNTGAISGNTPAESAAQKDMTKAANDAAASGASLATVAVTDVEKIASGELKAMFDAAILAKMKAKYTADTSALFGSKMQGRIEINPALAVKLDKDIFLGVYTSGPLVDQTVSFFEKHYSNQLKAVHLTQEGSYGMTVKISANIDTKGIDPQNLHFYAYNRKNNSLTLLVSPNSYADKNGFLHFSTIYGGDIVISDGPLQKQGLN